MIRNEQVIFDSPIEDFFKIFFPTILIFAMSFYQPFLAAPITMLFVAYVLDAGHVYSTMLEVYMDPIEVKKSYIWQTTLLAFAINFVILYFLNEAFFYYIFYFTIFHNLRQGLGVTFLYRKGQKSLQALYKYGYYLITVGPLILFHFRLRPDEGRVSGAILKSIDLFSIFNHHALQIIFNVGLGIYLLLTLVTIILFIVKKNTQGLLSFIFFGIVYAFAFLISKSETQSYFVLILSHTVPYYFLMQKRVKKTHSSGSIRKHAYLIIAGLFILGGYLDYYQYVIVDFLDDIDILVRALLVTPLIAHFLFDGIIWKHNNERFRAFVSTAN